MSGATITEAFIDKILALNYHALPREAIAVTKQVTLDTFAVTLAGSSDLDVGGISTAYVREMGGAPQATVITGGFKTSMQNAAYVNGTLAHALEYDAAWYPPNHPASPTLPAIFAIVNVWLKDGRQVSKRVDKLSGWVGSSLSPDQQLRKFYSCAQHVLDDKAANHLLELRVRDFTYP